MKVLMLMCAVVAVASGGYVEYDNSLGGGYLHEEAQLGPHGEVLDTDEVAQAKAVHFAEVAKARARLHGGGADEHPLDTPEVQVARFQHLLAHHEAHLRLANPALAHAAGPLDTAEVQVARAEHQDAHAEAELRAHDPAAAHAALPVDTFEVQKAKVEHFHAHAQAQYGGHSAPHDTAEVQLARFQHQVAQLQPQQHHDHGHGW